MAAKAALTAISNREGYRNRGPEYQSRYINERCFELILARRGTTMDLTKYPIPLDGKMIFNLNKVKTQNAEILDGDMLEEEAKHKAEHTSIENIRMKISQQVDNITRFDAHPEVGEGELIHVPIWFVHYTQRYRKALWCRRSNI